MKTDASKVVKSLMLSMDDNKEAVAVAIAILVGHKGAERRDMIVEHVLSVAKIRGHGDIRRLSCVGTILRAAMASCDSGAEVVALLERIKSLTPVDIRAPDDRVNSIRFLTGVYVLFGEWDWLPVTDDCVAMTTDLLLSGQHLFSSALAPFCCRNGESVTVLLSQAAEACLKTRSGDVCLASGVFDKIMEEASAGRLGDKPFVTRGWCLDALISEFAHKCLSDMPLVEQLRMATGHLAVVPSETEG